MEAAVGLLLVILGLCHGEETYCDGRQNGTQCYGALGGTVALRLMTSTSEIHKYEWEKNSTKILRGKKKNILFNAIANRSVFTPSDGTFRINNLSRSDGGEYFLLMFDSNGKETEKRTLQLFIQAPVSSVLLVSECLSRGEMRASCSSEGGDSPQYSWTLDGRTLADTDLLSGHNETKNITLKQGVSGRLVCTVSNHVSNISKAENISTCPGFIFINCTLSNGTLISQWVFRANNTLCIEPTTTSTTVQDTPATTIGKETDSVSNKTFTHIAPSNHTASSADDPWYIKYVPIMAGILAALVTLFLAGIAVYCCKNKNQSKKHHEEDEDHEVTYAEVKIVQRQTRHKQKKAEMEVEYGQVKVSGARRQITEPTEDDCVYAKVRKNR